MDIGKAAATAAQQGAALNTVSSGPANSGSFKKDRAESETAPQFGDVLKRMQSQYGGKQEKAREIKKTLGKDDFLKIMITQMQHQDPTNPFKAEQMAQQMAQFTSVEQLQNMNQGITKLAQANQPMERMAMTGLIGKTITIDRDRFPHIEGSNEALDFSLPRDATEVKVALISETGEVALEKDIGAQKKGDGTFAWDGLKSNSLPAKSGNYMLRVEAKDEKGSPIQIDSQTSARVIGVSFEGKEPVLLVGNNKQQAKVTMKSVVKIEADPSPGMSSMSAMPQAVPAPESQAPAAKPANFISFQKGVGSANLDPGQTSPEVSEALARYQQSQQQEAVASAAAAAPKGAAKVAASMAEGEKGFPNGLHE